MLKSGIFHALCGLMLCTALTAGRSMAAEHWVKQVDAHGFVVSHPAGWTVEKAQRKSIVVRSADKTEFVVIEPFKTDTSASDWLQANVAPQFKGGSVVDARQVSGDVDTVAGRISYTTAAGQQGQADVVCSLRDGSGILYAIAAPKSELAARRATLVRIAESFHFQALRSTHPGRTRQVPVHVRYVSWTDPREHAFHDSVPAGWKISGGLYRSGLLDIRPTVQAVDPGGDVQCVLGTKGIMIFAEPTPLMEQLGFHEGSPYSPGRGQQEIVLHYMSGEEFAKFYIEQALRKEVPDLKFTLVKNLPTLSAAVSRRQQVPGTNFMRITASAGEALFTGTHNGKPYVGYCEAIVRRTEYPSAGVGGMWTVIGLLTFTAPADKARLGSAVLGHMGTTFVFSQAFLRRVSNDAGAVADDIMRTNRANERNFQDMDNIITGTVDLVNPETGQTSQGTLGANYYWSNGSSTVGTNTYNPPGVDFGALKQVW